MDCAAALANLDKYEPLLIRYRYAAVKFFLLRVKALFDILICMKPIYWSKKEINS